MIRLLMNGVIRTLDGLATALHWCGDLLEWITESWSSPASSDEDEPSGGIDLGFDGPSSDDEISDEALHKEQWIRQMVITCAEQELSAETIRMNMLGLCRSLGALSQMAADRSDQKQTCMEAAGLIAVTASCERMLRSVSNFSVIRQYRFARGEDHNDS